MVIWFGLFVWLIWFIWLVSTNQTNHVQVRFGGAERGRTAASQFCRAPCDSTISHDPEQPAATESDSKSRAKPGVDLEGSFGVEKRLARVLSDAPVHPIHRTFKMT